MAGIDKAALLARQLPRESVEIEGVGTVVVRALSRAEVMALNASRKEGDPADLERRMIAAALVEPALTLKEVETWYANSPAGELSAVADAITRLSGMNPEVAKQAYRQFRGRPRK